MFCNTKVDVDQVTDMLQQQRMKVSTLHGGKSQEQRERALETLKQGATEILVCTNVAARGIDIKNVAHVVNY